LLSEYVKIQVLSVLSGSKNLFALKKILIKLTEKFEFGGSLKI